MLDGGGAPLSELFVRSNQKTNIEELATLLQTPPVGYNQKTERREGPPTPQRLLAVSDQKTENEELASRRGKNQKIETGDLPLTML